MNIGFFTHSSVGVSETFVYDLMMALNERAGNLIFFSGATSGKVHDEVRGVYTGYFGTPERGGYRRYKLGQAFGGKGNQFKFGFLQKSAERILSTYERQLRQLDVAHIEYGTSGALLYRLLTAYNIPFVIRVHAYDVTSAFSNAAYKAAFLAASRLAYGVVVVSNHIRRLLILAGVDASKIFVVRLGINGDAIIPKPWGQRLRGNPSVVHLGRLTPKKHPLALIHAFSLAKNEVNEARLSIIGDGPLLADCKDRVRQLGLEAAVEFHGALYRQEAFKELNRHWVFAQHSVTSRTGDQEGFPVSPAEAALHELPVVATAHSGITENVIEGETGYLVQEHDFETMAARIIYLMQHPETAEHMGKAGRQRILSMCNPRQNAGKIFDLLYEASKTSVHEHAEVLPLAGGVFY